MTIEPINANIHNEYGFLRTVIMCMANPFDLDMADLPDEFTDEVSLRQIQVNPHRPYDVNKLRAQQQGLIDVLEANGTEVLQARSLGTGVTQHFVRDVGFAIGELFFVARPRRMYRRAEIAGMEDLLARMERVHHIERGTIEGGDVLVDEEVVVVGLGEETDHNGIDELEMALNMNGIDKEIRRIEFTHGGTIHTDTLFNVVDPHTAFIHRPSFSEADYRWLADRYDLIEATRDECIGLHINSVQIGGGKVVMAEGAERLADAAAKRGLEPILIPYDEVNALPGSFRCTTCPIARG